MTVGILRHHVDGVADVGIAQRIGRPGRAGDIDPVALPLVADRTQPIVPI